MNAKTKQIMKRSKVVRVNGEKNTYVSLLQVSTCSIVEIYRTKTYKLLKHFDGNPSVCVCVNVENEPRFRINSTKRMGAKKVLNDADRKWRAMVGFETEAYILLSIAVIYFGL